MKKLLVCLFVVVFCFAGTAWAKKQGQGKGKKQGSVRVEETEQNAYKHSYGDDDAAGEKGEKVKNKEKHKGEKTEPPEGVQKAAEKGKGKKKGFFEKWFGGSKE